MAGTRERVLAVRRRTLSLAWPISIEQGFNTLMRTTDVVVVGAGFLWGGWAERVARTMDERERSPRG